MLVDHQEFLNVIEGFVGRLEAQLKRGNEIAKRRHQIEYALAQHKFPDIVYEVDTPFNSEQSDTPACKSSTSS